MRDSLSILSIETDDSVTHHGVKGMHWGVRKARYKQNVKSIKQKYKTMNKKIMKERSKDVKKYLTRLTGIARATYDTEMTRRHKDKIAINEFKKKQELKLAKAKLYKDINNRKSEKYLKKAREQFISIYSNRTVYKNPDGTFTVTRHYYNG